MAIWVIKDGQREGPYDEEDIRELVYEGTYGDADPAIQDGQYDWTTVGHLLGHEMPPFESALSAVGASAPLDVPAPQPPPVPVAGPERVLPVGPQKPLQVTVVDFQMPFGSMVTFMVKWVIAAIPALFILALVGGIFWVACVAVLALMLRH